MNRPAVRGGVIGRVGGLECLAVVVLEQPRELVGAIDELALNPEAAPLAKRQDALTPILGELRGLASRNSVPAKLRGHDEWYEPLRPTHWLLTPQLSPL